MRPVEARFRGRLPIRWRRHAPACAPLDAVTGRHASARRQPIMPAVREYVRFLLLSRDLLYGIGLRKTRWPQIRPTGGLLVECRKGRASSSGARPGRPSAPDSGMSGQRLFAADASSIRPPRPARTRRLRSVPAEAGYGPETLRSGPGGEPAPMFRGRRWRYLVDSTFLLARLVMRTVPAAVCSLAILSLRAAQRSNGRPGRRILRDRLPATSSVASQYASGA